MAKKPKEPKAETKSAQITGKTVGERIRSAREATGLSQNRLATESRLAQPFVNLIESGEREPSIETLIKIARILRVQPGELIPKIQID